MRLRIRHVLLSWAVSTTCSIALAPPAVAQSHFQNLFGFGGKPSAPAQARPAGRSLPAYRFRYHSRRSYQRDFAPDDEVIGPPDSGGPYRTMCVRSCDGFYFPLRHNAMQSNFAQDVKSCRVACGDEAHLYYYPVRGGSVDTMVDLAGQSYKDMPNAYNYRKALVSGCSCKPAPWSYEAVARHNRYAEEADELMADAVDKARQRYAAHLQATGAAGQQTPWQDKDAGAEGNAGEADDVVASDSDLDSKIVIGPPGPPIQYAKPPRRDYAYRRRAGSAATRARYNKSQPSGLFGWSLFGSPN
ncbi:MAG: DUF2865 domain-containing protein [Hyphomicrobium sp.]